MNIFYDVLLIMASIGVILLSALFLSVIFIKVIKYLADNV